MAAMLSDFTGNTASHYKHYNQEKSNLQVPTSMCLAIVLLVKHLITLGIFSFFSLAQSPPRDLRIIPTNDGLIMCNIV